eukprot:5097616-Pyramimonas_sp.AAC.1
MASLRAAPRASAATSSFEDDSKAWLSQTFISMTRDPDVRRRSVTPGEVHHPESRAPRDSTSRVEEVSVHQQYLARVRPCDVSCASVFGRKLSSPRPMRCVEESQRGCEMRAPKIESQR